MAQFGGESGGGRESNVDLNLVPFIDLMSVCIIFLLVTAVWTQVSMIQLGSSIYAKKNDNAQNEPPPRADVNIRVDVKSDGYFVMTGKNVVPIPKLDGAFDESRLLEYLKSVKEKYQDKNDATIAVADELPYEEAVRGMDVIINAGFSEVAVAATGAD